MPKTRSLGRRPSAAASLRSAVMHAAWEARCGVCRVVLLRATQRLTAAATGRNESNARTASSIAPQTPGSVNIRRGCIMRTSGVCAGMHTYPVHRLPLCHHTDARLTVISWANGHSPRASKAHHDLLCTIRPSRPREPPDGCTPTRVLPPGMVAQRPPWVEPAASG